MALTNNHSLLEVQLDCYISSIGTTPTIGYIRSPFRGTVLKVGLVQSGAVTGTAAVATAINGTAITGGSVSVTAGSAGTNFSAVPTAARSINEDGVISFTPSGATGTIYATAYAVIRKEA